MKKRCLPISTIASLFLVTLFFSAAYGAEKEGLRVEVVPKILVDGNAPTSSFQDSTPVNQEMALKATIRNISMKDTPESTIDYVVLVQRWGNETGTYSSYSGTEKLQALRIAEQVDIDIGKYHVGGHMHGGSDRHKDKLCGWKIVVNEGGKKIEFTYPSNFESMSKLAKPDRERRR